jgi:hypothetical protein
MAVDDASPATDMRAHRKYSAKIKALAANGHIVHRAMYSLPMEVLWLGRIVVTCNLDPASLEILPSLEMSNRDKVCLFIVQNSKVSFSSRREENVALVSEELPHLLRWLVEWPFPKLLVDAGSRYYVKVYHHKSVVQAIEDQSDTSAFVEILQQFLDEYKRAGQTVVSLRSGDFWIGTPAALHHLMVSTESVAAHMHAYPLKQLRRMLRALESQGYVEVEYNRFRNVPGHEKQTRAWKLPFFLTTDRQEYEDRKLPASETPEPKGSE